MSYLRNPRSVSPLFHILLIYTQLEAGYGTHILSTSAPVSHSQSTWLTHTIQFMQDNDITISITDAWVPPLQREKDAHIIDLVTRHPFSTTELKHINQCRLYLQVIYLSDIFTFNGKQLEQWVWKQHIPHRTSKWTWPQIAPPSTYQWNIWKTAIRTIFFRDGRIVV